MSLSGFNESFEALSEFERPDFESLQIFQNVGIRCACLECSQGAPLAAPLTDAAE